MRTWFSMFMLGRNGVDFLNKRLFIAAAVLTVLERLLAGFSGIFPAILAGYALFRTLSRNLSVRQMEDLAAREACDKLKAKLAGLRLRVEQGRDYRFFTCPGCGGQLRVPRGKGRIQITCPRCGQRFEGTT